MFIKPKNLYKCVSQDFMEPPFICRTEKYLVHAQSQAEPDVFQKS